ncbi:MAG: NADH-quinone oxidoreductase subunit J [Rubrivivax sp.]|nr:NADH-quinone oxidoreductase subunit J [Rubrivivax sp.]
MTQAFVVFFGVLALFFAGLVLLLRQPMRAALALVAHMISLAAIYATLGVHVVALFQVLIYVGAVMVFMVYTIMLLDDRDASFTQPFSRLTLPAVVVAVLLAVVLLGLLGTGPVAPDTVASGTTPAFGFMPFALAFMKQYAYHFELATVLLLAGIVAAWTAIRESLDR